MIITIDGPSVSGKSTVARAVAKELHYFYIASGSIYRGLAYALMHARGYTQDTIAQAAIADVVHCLDESRFVYEYNEAHAERIIFEGADVTDYIKTPAMDAGASLLGTNDLVRKQILNFIRTLACDRDIVIDGRDCGSVMFPSADYKFYLTASLPVRAQRWQAMQAKLNKNIPIDQAMAIIADRDDRDSNRAIAPLKIPQGAYSIDSSDLNAQDVVALIVRRVRGQKKEEA